MAPTTIISNKNKKSLKRHINPLLIALACFVCVCALAAGGVYAFVGIAFKHTISLYATTGQLYETISVDQNGKITLPVPCEYFDRTFAGWFTDAALTKPFDENTRIQKSLRLYHGGYITNQYTITLVDPSGTNQDIVTTLPAGSSFSFTRPLITPDGFTFKGYTEYARPNAAPLCGSDNPEKEFENFVQQNTTYYVYWEGFSYGTTTASSSTVKVELNPNLPSVLTESTISDWISFPSNVCQKLDIPPHNTALWFALPNLVSHNPQEDNTYTVSALKIKNKGYQSFSFGGWTLDPTSEDAKTYRDGEPIDLGALSQDNTITFFALWITN